MPKIKFTQRRVLQDEHRGTHKETVYEEGSVHDLSAGSADHWKNRGAAVDHVEVAVKQEFAVKHEAPPVAVEPKQAPAARVDRSKIEDVSLAAPPAQEAPKPAGRVRPDATKE